jgi:hypothetical protein
MGERYVAKRASGFPRLLWRVRAQLEDTQAGETLDVRTEEIARELGAVLALADAGQLEPLPAAASPFPGYESLETDDGCHYLLRAEGALDQDSFARTKSDVLATRLVEALNRADPRKLRDPYGPSKFPGWF